MAVGLKPVLPGPIWDSSTTHTNFTFGGAGSDTFVVPDQCYWVCISPNTNVDVFVSNDATSDEGIRLDGNGLNPFSTGVAPGTTIHIHASGAVEVNVFFFYG